MQTQIMKVKLTWQTEEELRIPICETEEETKQWIINRIKEFQIILLEPIKRKLKYYQQNQTGA